MAHSEDARQWVHIASGSFALLLRFLAWWQAALFAISALVFNVLLLPHVGGRRLIRPLEHARYPLGIVLYPLAVLALVLVFASRLDIAAAAWAILALGDGTATLVGRRARSARLPWNPDKSVAGMVAFAVFAAAGGVALAWWTAPAVDAAPSLTFIIVAPCAAALAAALVETLPVGLDDNLSVPFAAGSVLWLGSLSSTAALSASRDLVVANLPWALAVNAVTSWLGYRARTVTRAGMIGGALIGVVIYTAGGFSAWIFLFVTFLAAAVTSRVGLRKKVLLGIAEERSGRRGAGNAFANCGVAALAAIAAIVTPYRTEALLALAAALTAGGSDTVASEIGKAFGGRTYLVTTARGVPPGTPGAMSLEGTAAGVVAALALGALGAGLGLVPWSALLAMVAAATAGALVESALAATLEGPGILNNDMLNFINTAVAAGVALAVV